MTFAAMGDALVWMLAAFFLVGAGINGVAPKSIREDYARWGYPGGFHYVTAGLELCVAVGLLFAATRLPAALLGAAVMAAAAGTTLYRREPARAVAPLVVLTLSIAVVLIVRPYGWPYALSAA